MTTEDLLKLPWDLQVPLASGYAAYVLAYTGLRDRQKTVDVAFISLVFSLIATAVLAYAAKHGVDAIKASASAFGITVLSGLLWRKLGRPLVIWALRATNITWSNDDPSALASLGDSTKFYVTQVAVHLDDGTCMSCGSAADFNGSPFGPLQIGPNGDIALYATEVYPVEGDPRPQTNVRNAHYGDRMTYIPASRIRHITMRHRRHTSFISRMKARWTNRVLPEAVVDSVPSQPEREGLSVEPSRPDSQA